MNAPFLSASCLPTTAENNDGSERAADIAVIVDHQGHRLNDDDVLSRVVQRLGWGVLTDEALHMLAREHEAAERRRERRAAESRAHYAAGRGR